MWGGGLPSPLFILSEFSLGRFLDGICYNGKMKPLNVFGLTIFLAGLLTIVGFGFYKFFEDSTVPIVVKLGIIAIALGIIIILVSLTKERLKEKKS
jgi:hypothetical protein